MLSYASASRFRLWTSSTGWVLLTTMIWGGGLLLLAMKQFRRPRAENLGGLGQTAPAGREAPYKPRALAPRKSMKGKKKKVQAMPAHRSSMADIEDLPIAVHGGVLACATCALSSNCRRRAVVQSAIQLNSPKTDDACTLLFASALLLAHCSRMRSGT